MKKFNFLSIAVVALLMFFGMNAVAQDYFPSNVAVELVQKKINELKGTFSSTHEVNKDDAGAILLNSFKIRVGSDMLEPLKSGVKVDQAITDVVANIRNKTTKMTPERNNALQETERFYRTYLKKH